jgi:c-di-GMP-binding flagellar brake protein YcgR
MELEQIIREIYRVPITKNDNISAQINGENFEVVNLGSHGVGIRTPRGSFSVDDDVREIKLMLKGEILRFSGKVVHVTSYKADTYLCGIRLIDMDEVSQQKLLDCVYRIRANLFTKQ